MLYNINHNRIKANITHILIIVFCSSNLLGQKITEEKETTFYREDQFYFGTSFMLLNSNQEAFKPKGLSRHFQLGFVRDIPLNISGRFATGVGLGIDFERYTTNLIQLEEGIYSLSDLNDESYEPLFISVQSIEFPLSLRWRNSSPSNYTFWRLYGGLAFQWHYRSRAKQNDSFITLSDELQAFGSKAYISFGYNTWNFYFSYRLQPFFSSKGVTPDALPIKLTPIKIGLIFYVL